jgi:hypothetical protein
MTSAPNWISFAAMSRIPVPATALGAVIGLGLLTDQVRSRRYDAQESLAARFAGPFHRLQ